ncbi:PepSY-associated TM helix domain-containing protein [Henriciella aquimarina]|uniref:PepSY-associated TM helix domain-containing protein n=1 Tax=Henriciella aquimarina TaxID=545261 RepID=UPI0009FD1C1B|nr:PepSY-associated TM helix domain-containing protein [Henriciella aquimarina]
MARAIWPKVPSRFVSAMLAGHSALGLAFAALIYIVCLSGTVLVVAHEIDRWENPDAPIIHSVDTDTLVRALDVGMDKAEQAGTHGYVNVTTPADGHPNLSVRIADFQTGLDETFVLNGEGDLMGPRRDGFGHFMEHLHFYLHLPHTIGLFVVGLIGVALLSSVWSGVFSHPRIFRDAFRFRRGGTKRLEEADLHNRLSVWGLPFHIVVPLTGAILGLSTFVLGILAMAAFDGDLERAAEVVGGPGVPHDEAVMAVPDVAPMIESLKADHPDGRLARLAIREFGTAGQTIQIDLAKASDLTITDRYIFDGNGTYLGSRGFSDGSLGNQVIGALGPLHFGWFSKGWVAGVVKGIYLVLGFALTVITSSGVAIWIARRRDKGKPVPGWEKAWIALVWGQPVGYGAVALVALAGLPVPHLGLYLVLCAAAFLPGLFVSALTLSRALRIVSAAVILGVVIAHIARYGVLPADAMALVINLSLLATSLLLLASVQPILQTFRPATKPGIGAEQPAE